jgi:hypothetical protein
MNGLSSQADPPTPVEAEEVDRAPSLIDGLRPPPSTVAYLYRNIVLPALTSTVMALVVAYFLRDHFPDPWLAAWLGAILVVNGARYLVLGYGRTAPPKPAETPRWMVLYLASVVFGGFAWGAAGWFFFPMVSVPLQVFLAFILGGMAVGAMASYGAWRPAFFAYTVPSLVPIMVRFLWESAQVSIAMGACWRCSSSPCRSLPAISA